MRKLCILFAVIFSICSIPTSYADGNTAVYENVKVLREGQEQDFTITILKDGDITFVPMRSLFEIYNISVNWDAKRNQIRTSAMGSSVISIGSPFVLYGGRNHYWMESYPRIYNGATMIPVSFAEDCMGVNLSYLEFSNTLMILSK